MRSDKLKDITKVRNYYTFLMSGLRFSFMYRINMKHTVNVIVEMKLNFRIILRKVIDFFY